jgi:hypothetical protein
VKNHAGRARSDERNRDQQREKLLAHGQSHHSTRGVGIWGSLGRHSSQRGAGRA